MTTVFVDGASVREQASEATGPRDAARVAIVGLGYVGLPTALAFANAGQQVIGLDLSEDRLRAIRCREVDLSCVDHSRLKTFLEREDFVITNAQSELRRADCVVICVPTPIDDHLLPDLRLLRAACASVVTHAREGQLICLTSTTYVGSTRDMLIEPLRARGLVAGRNVNVVFSPERINPGVDEHPQSAVPRVVGGATDACARRAQQVFAHVTNRVHTVSTVEAAELTKLFENTFRAVNISLVNEFANACGALEADVMEVLDAAATKPFGFMKFTPGPGVGGHCIPCDPHYLLWQMRSHRLRLPIVESAMNGIASRPAEVVARAERMLGARGISPGTSRVLLVGAAYKPNVEDVRESPAIEIVARLLEWGAEVTISDPHAHSISLPNGVSIVCRQLTSLDVKHFDLVIVHTKHDADDLRILEAARLVLDTTYSLSGPIEAERL